MKARCAQKPDLEMKIYSQFTAREAKLLGNTLSMSLDGHCNWMKKRVAVMKEILEHKFAQVPQFRVALKTGFTYVEDTSDEFWGYGLTPRKVKTGLPQDYPGRNVMGCLLTQLSRYHTLDASYLPRAAKTPGQEDRQEPDLPAPATPRQDNQQ